MKHIMVDLETLGTVPGCVILSIGAVVFDPVTGTLGDEFYRVINIASCREVFLSVDPATEKWWAGQSAEAKAVVDEASAGGHPLKIVLEDFNAWLRRFGGARDVRIYGNGADFDNPILSCAYDAAGVKPGYAAYVGRCYRTLKNLDELFGPQFKAHKLERGGTHHNALDDAKSQARHLMEIVDSIKAAIIDDH